MADFRFPGSRPFETHESALFFGRSLDAQALYAQLLLQQSLVLHSKSGLGKSSLLNAALVPLLQESGKYRHLRIRFSRYTPGEEGYVRPVEKLIGGLIARRKTDKPKAESPTEATVGRDFLDRIIPQENSLWYFVKKWQCRTNDSQTLVLVFDQFEELFSYPEADVFPFKKQLAELLRQSTPQHFRKVLEVKQRKEPDLLNPAELEALELPLRVKVLFAIRSDRMSLLERLRDYLPDVLRSTIELRALTREQAHEAITRPAGAEGDFLSPKFGFVPPLVESLLDYLSANRTKDIETFQLQLVCKYAEQLVREGHSTLFLPGDLGDYATIFGNHYNRTIDQLDVPARKHAARILVEEQLIVEGNRVTLSDTALLHAENRALGIDQRLLQELVDAHLLRSEPNSLGGLSYELAHDTLVAPILESRNKRLEQQEIVKILTDSIGQLPLGDDAPPAELRSIPDNAPDLFLEPEGEKEESDTDLAEEKKKGQGPSRSRERRTESDATPPSPKPSKTKKATNYARSSVDSSRDEINQLVKKLNKAKQTMEQNFEKQLGKQSKQIRFLSLVSLVFFLAFAGVLWMNGSTGRLAVRLQNELNQVREQNQQLSDSIASYKMELNKLSQQQDTSAVR